MKERSSIVPIEYHADDFALFPEQSKRILNCHVNGKLNGVSVMPNSECLEECMTLFRPHQEDIAITVHLNLIEGHSVSKQEEVSLLTDENGVFRNSFGKLLIHSFLPDREIYREQLKKELRGQISVLLPYLPENTALRLDGHAHYHMLPVVFDALMDVLREENWKVSYIRIPWEDLMLYLRHWKHLKDFSPINLVKVLILNLLSWRNSHKYRDFLDSLEQKVFVGVFLSGRMYRENIALIMPDVVRLAQSKSCAIEVLAHPGGVYEAEDIAKLTCPADISFLSSERRGREAASFAPFDKEEKHA